MSETQTFTAFDGHDRVAGGTVEDVADALCSYAGASPVLIFDDATGRQIELDLRHGAPNAVVEYRARTASPAATPPRQGRGRPKLGVVAREVTLLPRHWDWLATQPGGASAAIRRLVEEARRNGEGPDRARRTQEAAYRVMSALAGDLPNFEEASRALFAGDHARLEALASDWPGDIRTFVLRLAAPT
ncbi:MAG: DUF2239 family protein [Alphaproteobacteria bacterium]|nr:DUF2239 family protein [Alphaproteobacteria bacterium]MBU1516877.1 DUF2239 family protein [Alphaproteobacteria bacterium]MBU2092572.1 DUF2239 family protein [Alphaproteobacteria bacterium]MBU2151317.1 DUF2239 family protein [Alphaproteobacteria bacterium]MBU2309619.1 DUF2239 family protein [Alphaproteobacteria bacterium]